MKWRSLPHVVVSPTRTSASRGLTIVGSGTSSTARSLIPFQQRARIDVASMGVWPAVAGVRVAVERRDLAGLDEGLEAVERLEHGGARDPGGQRAAVGGLDREADLAAEVAWG